MPYVRPADIELPAPYSHFPRDEHAPVENAMDKAKATQKQVWLKGVAAVADTEDDEGESPGL